MARSNNRPLGPADPGVNGKKKPIGFGFFFFDKRAPRYAPSNKEYSAPRRDKCDAKKENSNRLGKVKRRPIAPRNAGNLGPTRPFRLTPPGTEKERPRDGRDICRSRFGRPRRTPNTVKTSSSTNDFPRGSCFSPSHEQPAARFFPPAGFAGFLAYFSGPVERQRTHAPTLAVFNPFFFFDRGSDSRVFFFFTFFFLPEWDVSSPLVRLSDELQT